MFLFLDLLMSNESKNLVHCVLNGVVAWGKSLPNMIWPGLANPSINGRTSASGQCKIKVEAASLGVLYWEEVSKFRSSPPEGTDRDGPQDIDHSLEMFVITSEKLWSVLEPDLQFRQPIWRRQTRPSQ